MPGAHRHDDLFRGNRLGQRHAVQGTRAAERHQREFSRIDAARDRVGADRQRHVRIDDFDDAERRFGYRQAQRLRDLRLDGLVREVGVERQVAAQHFVDVKAPEDDLRVGHGRLLAAPAVTGRAGFGAGRARPDMKAARGIDIGDRSATGADRNKIDHRHQDRMAVHVGVARIHDLDAAVGDGADVGGRAADIDGDEVRTPAQHSLGPAADHAARRTRHQDADGLLRAGLDGGDAAVRLNDPQIGAETVFAQLVLQVVEVERGLGSDEGVHRRGREPFVFADHVGDLGRRTDVGVRHFGANDFSRAPLVRVVEKREQKADDDGFDAPPFEQLRRLDDFRLGERDFDPSARRQDALGHRDAVAPFDQRPLLPGNFEMQRKIVRPLVPADMKDVAEVTRREHPDFGAVMLDGDVGRDRRAVHDQRYIVGTNAGDLAQFAQAL